MSEGGIRVPFLIRWTDRLPSGKVYDQPVISLDVVSTVLFGRRYHRAAGTSARRRKSCSLFDGLYERSTSPCSLWRFGPEEAIRKGDFKWVRHRGQVEPMLFNLASDIGEKTDLSGEMPEIMADLAADYAKWSEAMMEPRIIKQSQPGRVDRSKRTVAQRFAQGDKNGDGKLTPDEVKSDEKFHAMGCRPRRNSDTRRISRPPLGRSITRWPKTPIANLLPFIGTRGLALRLHAGRTKDSLPLRGGEFRPDADQLGQIEIKRMVLGGVFSGFWCKPECKL